MSILSNAKHERFAQEIAKGVPASVAYVNAGYKKSDGNAIRLKGNDRVRARVAEIVSEAAQKAEVTVERVVAELAGLAFVDLEKSAKVKASDKRAALVDLGNHLGVFVERHEVAGPNKKPLDLMTAEAAEKLARGVAAIFAETDARREIKELNPHIAGP